MSHVVRKSDFCIRENKDADQLCVAVTAKLISAFVFHGQETHDFSASFPFLNWRPPLRLIGQLAIYFLVFLR